VATKRRAKKRKGVTAKQRASDDKLRERLQHFDVKVLDRALAKAIKSPASSPRH
jgi:hypothetical protein